MTPSAVLRRIEALEKLLASDRCQEALAGLAQAGAERRISDGKASETDFRLVVGSDLDECRRAMVDAAVAESPTGIDAVRGSAWDVVCQILRTDPSLPIGDAYSDLLTQAGEAPVSLGESWVVDAWGSNWFYANVALLLLGKDHGATLRASAAPGVQQALAEKEARDLEIRRKLQHLIETGAAGWVQFQVFFDKQHEADHAVVRAEAVRRRQAREADAPEPVDTLLDFAAEIVSYPTTEEPPAYVVEILDSVCNMATPLGVDGHDEWIEANRWRRALGGGWGVTLRRHLTDNWADYLNPPAPSAM